MWLIIMEVRLGLKLRMGLGIGLGLGIKIEIGLEECENDINIYIIRRSTKTTFIVSAVVDSEVQVSVLEDSVLLVENVQNYIFPKPVYSQASTKFSIVPYPS